MTTLVPAAIEPSVQSAVRIGLFQSALPFAPDVRWTGGVSYRPLNANIPAAANSTFYPCNAAFSVTTQDTSPVSWDPWGIALGDECLAGSTDEEEERARANRRLEIQTEYLTGRTFWTGDVGSSDFATVGAPNRPLADPASDLLTITGPVGVVTAFSLAVQYLADTVGSMRGMIHIPPKLIPFAAFYDVVRREGFQVLTTIADHVVVASPGYTGTSPDGEPDDASSTWIYVTTQVRAAAAPVQVHAALNRVNNDWETRASRVVIAEWDLQAHAAIQVCIPDPGPSCTEVPS